MWRFCLKGWEKVWIVISSLEESNSRLFSWRNRVMVMHSPVQVFVSAIWPVRTSGSRQQLCPSILSRLTARWLLQPLQSSTRRPATYENIERLWKKNETIQRERFSRRLEECQFYLSCWHSRCSFWWFLLFAKYFIDPFSFRYESLESAASFCCSKKCARKRKVDRPLCTSLPPL